MSAPAICSQVTTIILESVVVKANDPVSVAA